MTPPPLAPPTRPVAPPAGPLLRYVVQPALIVLPLAVLGLILQFVPHFPRAIAFVVAYHSIEEGMSFEEVDRALADFRRDDFFNGALGLDPVPYGGVWFCALGGTRNFNTIRVRFDDAGVLEKTLTWEERFTFREAAELLWPF